MSKNSKRILEATGFDFQRPFTKRFSDSTHKREEALRRKRHESEERLKKARVPQISEHSREIVGDRFISI